MGVNIGSRCCGRNLLFDIVTGGDSDSCPQTCQTINSLAELPNPNTCDFVYLYEITADPITNTGVMNAAYYKHDGVDWVQVAGVSAPYLAYFGGQDFDTVFDLTLAAGWTATVYGDFYDTSGQYPVPFTASSIGITFTETETECVYDLGEVGVACQVACETIYDLGDLPNPVVCSFVYYEPVGDMIDHTYYLYSGGIWQPIYEFTNVVQSSNGEVTSITFTILAGWSLSLDGFTWYDTGGTYDTTGQGANGVYIRNDANLCQYQGQSFTYITSAIVSDADLADFAGWTYVNGDFSDLVGTTFYWESLFDPSIYTNVNIPTTNPNNDSYRIFTFYGNTTPPDLQIFDDLANPITPTFQVYYPVCMQTTFTVSDPSLATPINTIAFNVSGFGNYAGSPDLADAGINAFLSAQRFNTVSAINSVFVTLDGNDVTITLIDAFNYSPYGVNVDDNGSPVSGTFVEIPCP